MKNLRKYLIWALWISVLALLIFSFTRVNKMDESQFEVYQSFDTFKEISSNPLVYSVALEDQEVGWLSFGEAYGYQSNITIGTVIGLEGTVLEVGVMDQNETPSFIEKIYNALFLEQFTGIKITDGFDLENNIQAVTGATVSSKAITKAVTLSSQIIGSQYLSMEVPVNTKIKFGVTEIVILGMLVLAVLSYKLKNKQLRLLTMAYSILLLGFKYKQFIAYSWIVSLVTGKVPSFSESMGWYLLIFGTLLLIAATGKNLYCAYICPFGALQKTECKVACFKFFKVSPQLKKFLRHLPAILAYVGFVIAMVTEHMGALSFEPFSLIYGRNGVGIQWAMLPIVLIMSLFVMGFYCHSACPVGFVLNQVVKLRRKIVELTGKSKSVETINRHPINTKQQDKKMVWQVADIVMLVTVTVVFGLSLLTILGNA